MASKTLLGDAAKTIAPNSIDIAATLPLAQDAENGRVSHDAATAPTSSSGSDTLFVSAGAPTAQAAVVAQAAKTIKPRLYPFMLDLTEAEGQAIEALRLWQRAEEDRALLTDLLAWQALQHDVSRFRDGDYTLADAIDSVDEDQAAAHFAAVTTIARLFERVFLQEPRGSNAQTNAQEAPTATEGDKADTSGEAGTRDEKPFLEQYHTLSPIGREIMETTLEIVARGNLTPEKAAAALRAITQDKQDLQEGGAA